MSLVAALAAGVISAAVRWRYWGHDTVPDLVATDASVHVVREYIDEFDSDGVSDPFG